MPFKVATFNLAWFGSKKKKQWLLTPERFEIIAKSLSELDADILVLQEICDLSRLGELFTGIEKAKGRGYQVVDDEKQWLATPSKSKTGMKTAVAFDRSRLSLSRWGTISGTNVVRPFIVVELLHEDSGKLLSVIGVHFKSAPFDDPGKAAEKQRKAECDLLAEVAQGKALPDTFKAKLGDLILIAGDFNGTIDGRWWIDE